MARTSQADFARQQEIVGEISGFVTEMIGNQKLSKAFEREAINQEQFEMINDELNLRGRKAQFSSSLTNPLSRFVDHLSYLSVGFVGGLLYFSGSGLVTVGMISSFTIYSSQFSKPFIELSGITTQIQTALAGLARTFQLLDQVPESADDTATQAMKEIKGKIDFENVAFAYDPGQKLIENFSLQLNQVKRWQLSERLVPVNRH